MTESLSVNDIKTMNYPDFIGTLGLENISLAGDFTVDYWISKSNINEKSKILEIACSTGFNLRYCILKTGAMGIGIDTSRASINCAQEIKNICAERLLEIHLTINENARHQIGKLQIWQLKS